MVQTHGFRLRISSCSFFGIVYHGESYNQPPKKYSFLYNICQSSKVKHLIVAQVSGGTKGHIHHLSAIWCQTSPGRWQKISQHRSRCLCNSVYMKGRRQPFGYPDICIAKKCLPCPARLKVRMLDVTWCYTTAIRNAAEQIQCHYTVLFGCLESDNLMIV